jgi:hypothetical protein
MKPIRNVLIGIAFLSAVGCASYYSVTDPTTGKIYYTTNDKMDQSNSGSTSFIDARTGDHITLQNTQVSQITEQQYENGKNGVEPSTEPSK